jgi:hypothetical protein
VAILDQASDPAPPIPASGPGFDWNAFVNLVRSHNNITWRNFNVVDVLPDPSADPAVLDFLIAGSPDAARQFDLEVIQRMPQRARVELEVPLALLAVMPKTGFVSRKVDRRTGRARLMLPSTRGLPLCSVRLSAAARHRCRLLVHGDPALAGGLHRIAVRQIFDGIEVGRVTFGLRVKR